MDKVLDTEVRWKGYSRRVWLVVRGGNVVEFKDMRFTEMHVLSLGVWVVTV